MCFGDEDVCGIPRESALTSLNKSVSVQEQSSLWYEVKLCALKRIYKDTTLFLRALDRKWTETGR